jgi:branched-chain amino acid transport system permease protein
MVVLGGMGSISGAVFAATLLTILPEWLRQPTHVWPIGLAAVLLVLAVTRGRRPRLAAGIGAATLVLELLAAWARASGIDLADYRMILYALSLIVMMILRPQGLFGVHEVWELGPRRVRSPPRDGADPVAVATTTDPASVPREPGSPAPHRRDDRTPPGELR